MANPPTLPPAPDGPQSDPGVQQLTRFIRRAGGSFALIIAVCDRADYRDRCISLLTETSGGVAVALNAATDDPLLAARQAVQGGAQVIHLTDLELAVPANESRLGPMRQLNLRRGEWVTLGCPVILWVANYLLGIVLRRAPDFADWRSGSVLLTPPAADAAERGARLSDSAKDYLWNAAASDAGFHTAAQREERALELSERLAAARTTQGVADATDHIEALWMREIAVHLIYLGRGAEAEAWAVAAIHHWEKAAQPREVAITVGQLGDAWNENGNLQNAVVAAEQALTIDEAQLVANPQSAQAARDVSISLERLGDFLAERGLSGDAGQALLYYERGLKVREELLSANPQSAQSARDVSVSLDRLGDFLARRGLAGDAEQALLHYERSLKVREELLSANPQSGEAVRDVSVSLTKLADFLAERGLSGDAEQALLYYERSLKVSEELLSANPQSAQSARDVSISLERLGDFLAERGLSGDAGQALLYYERSLKVREELLSANPQSAQSARDVSISLNNLADFLARRGLSGDAEQALLYYERSLNVREELLSANPQSAQAARDVWVSCWKMARMEEQSGSGDAMQWWRRAFEILDGMKREGRFIAAADEGYLEQLRLKVGE